MENYSIDLNVGSKSLFRYFCKKIYKRVYGILNFDFYATREREREQK